MHEPYNLKMNTQDPNMILRARYPGVHAVLRWLRWRTVGYFSALVAASVALPFAWPGLAENLFATGFGGAMFMPHGHCYLWVPALWRLHVGTDALIGSSYVAISLTLAYLVHQARRDIPFQWVFLFFGLFIIACGATHFMEVWTLWTATYWLSGYVKLVTAVASLATAVVLPPLVPKALALVRDAKLSDERRTKLETANRELESLYEKTKELDQLKTLFFANASHELRTPLALILGPTERLLTSSNLTQDQHRAIEAIARNARSLLTHVNDLLDLSKLEAGRMQMRYTEIDLAQHTRFIASHFEILAGEKSIRYTVKTPEALSAQVDAEKGQRIVLNLLANAFRFTPIGGTVALTLGVEGGSAILQVEDNGPGVPADLREAIFEPFRQVEGGTERPRGGTGLGLAIVKEFVDLHGGAVRVTEAPSGGALFTVTLPLTAPADADIQSASGTLDEELSRQTLDELHIWRTPTASPISAVAADAPLVLVVEDHPDMNSFVCDALGRYYRIATAFDGKEGLAKALALHPDLIVSDVMMPGMSGEQMIGALRRYPEMEDVPIVMLTAKADDVLRVKLLRAGVQDYVNKPCSVEELLVRVGRIINEHRRSELALRESEKRFRLLVQSAVDAIVITDESQRIVFFNPAAEQIFKCSENDAVGTSLDRFIPPRFREIHRQHVERFMETGVTRRRIGEARELSALRADGEEFPMEASISRIEVGGRILLAVTLRDITERKAAEMKLREQAEQLREADRRKDEFLAMLAHELRNPLTPIRNAVAALHRMPFDSPAISAACAMVDYQVEHLTCLVDDLLDVSRITRGKMTLRKTRCDLVALVREVAKDHRSRMEGHGLTLTWDLPDHPLWVQGDRTRLVQVVGNLLDNAGKFTPPGGAVTVDLSPISEPKPSAPGRVALTVRDTGIGIASELLPHIFEPFRQLPQSIDRGLGGLGLGLALVRSIVDLHGGEVTAESGGEGLGAVLTVRLPLEPAASLPVAGEVAAPGAHNSLRVLLIEDNKEVAESTRMLIELMGHRVQVARNGAEGLAVAMAFRPEVVLCDIGLPGEVDGYAVARRLRQDPELASAYLVALTGYGHEAAREQTRSAGFDQHVTKPFKAACLEELLAARSEGKEMRPGSEGRLSDSTPTEGPETIKRKPD